jgi:hypothetical protein
VTRARAAGQTPSKHAMSDAEWRWIFERIKERGLDKHVASAMLRDDTTVQAS